MTDREYMKAKSVAWPHFHCLDGKSAEYLITNIAQALREAKEEQMEQDAFQVAAETIRAQGSKQDCDCSGTGYRHNVGDGPACFPDERCSHGAGPEDICGHCDAGLPAKKEKN